MPLRSLLLAAAVIALPAPALAQGAAVSPAAKAAHRDAIVLDSHFDTPALLGREGWSILDRHTPELDGSQVDLPRMIEGGVDGGFFAVFTAQGPRTEAGHAAARDAALYRLVEIREMAARHDEHFRLAFTADEAEAIAKANKRFVIISMENSYPVGRDLSLMDTFHRLGVRVMGPVHTTHNELADSSTDAKGPEHGGLSPLGREWVAKANRMGVLIDGSHASDETLDQLIALSKAPIILTHTGVKAVFDHKRNIDDDRLRALAAKGGVIQINVFSGYMIAVPTIPERTAALEALAKQYPDQRTQAQQVAYTKARREIDARWPVPRATFEDAMNHILHAIRVAGIDHVGLSGDFDGGGGVTGLNDVTAYPKITERLLKEGYSKADVAKFWGGNALRVLRQAQALAETP